MADKKPLSSYQKGVVKRYYEHKDDIAIQNLGEIVSELYTQTIPHRINALWKRAEAALVNAGVKEERYKDIVASRDLAGLAKLLEEKF